MGYLDLPVEGCRGATELTVIEDGEVYNPLFRFVSRLIIGHTATIDVYLAALHKRLG